ncbi:unnamed protein product, partial [Prorocentrum cordatum]
MLADFDGAGAARACLTVAEGAAVVVLPEARAGPWALAAELAGPPGWFPAALLGPDGEARGDFDGAGLGGGCLTVPRGASLVRLGSGEAASATGPRRPAGPSGRCWAGRPGGCPAPSLARTPPRSKRQT